MRKIINRRLYDTNRSELIHYWNNGVLDPTDFRKLEESLYRTEYGAFFLAGRGGAMTRYARPYESNGTTEGWGITPIGQEEAIEWLEEHEGTEALIEHFGGEEAFLVGVFEETIRRVEEDPEVPQEEKERLRKLAEAAIEFAKDTTRMGLIQIVLRQMGL